MAEYGLAQGLAVRGNSGDMISDIERHDMRMMQNKSLAEAKAKLFADSMAYQNSANSFDNPLIKAHNDAVIKEIGQFYKENPDARYNKDKLLFIEQKRRTLMDNEHVLRAKASDDAFRQMNEYLAEVSKNPNGYNQAAIDRMLEQKKNYLAYGNQAGIEDREKNGMKPFVFVKPKDFVDLTEVYRKVGSSMEARGFEELNNGRDGAYRTFARPDDLMNEAKAIYQQNKDQLDQEFTSKGIDPIVEVGKRIVPYVKTDYKIGEKNRLAEQMALAKYEHSLKMAENQIKNTGRGSFYDSTVLATDWVKAPAEKISATFGSTLPHFLPAGKDGKPIDNTGDVFIPEGDIYDKGFRADGKYKKTGIKVIDGFVRKPIQFGVDAGYLYDPTGLSGDPSLAGTDYSDYEIKPEYKKYVSFVDTPMDKEGKSAKVLKIKTQAEVDSRNPTYRGNWDDNLLTTKQKDAYGVEDGGGQGTYQGYAVGSTLNTTEGRFLVTPNGYKKIQ